MPGGVGRGLSSYLFTKAQQFAVEAGGVGGEGLRKGRASLADDVGLRGGGSARRGG